MACDITLGRLEPCKTVGGLKAIYFCNWDDVDYGEFTFDADEELITTGGNDIPLYKYDLRGANTMDETGESSDENGTAFWTTAGTIQLKAQDAVTRKQIKLLSYGRPRIITEGWDGNFKMYGIKNGCTVSSGTNSGANMGDFNGYTLTIVAKEDAPAVFVDPAIIGDNIQFNVIAGV